MLASDLKPRKYLEKINHFQTNCTICLEDYKNNSEVIYLFCKHIFHFKCLKNWLDKNILMPKCPNCNYNVLIGGAPADLNFNFNNQINEDNYLGNIITENNQNNFIDINNNISNNYIRLDVNNIKNNQINYKNNDTDNIIPELLNNNEVPRGENIILNSELNVKKINVISKNINRIIIPNTISRSLSQNNLLENKEIFEFENLNSEKKNILNSSIITPGNNIGFRANCLNDNENLIKEKKEEIQNQKFKRRSIRKSEDLRNKDNLRLGYNLELTENK